SPAIPPLSPYTTLFRSIRGRNNTDFRVFTRRNSGAPLTGRPDPRKDASERTAKPRTRSNSTRTSPRTKKEMNEQRRIIDQTYSRSEEHTSELQSRFDLV